MFHVPGSYSGGEAPTHRWTQTRETIELVVPVDAAARDVSVRFAPRALRVSAGGGGAPPALDGELHGVVVVDECVWAREDDPPQLAITLRKAIAALWPKLLAADADAAEPTLLDGPARALGGAAAGAPAGAGAAAPRMPTSKVRPHVVSGHADTRVVVHASQLPPLCVLTFRACTNCELELSADASAVKLLVEACEGCELRVRGKVTTETLEVWRSDALRLAAHSPLRTVQLDECGAVALHYEAAELFERVARCGVRELRVTFGDSEEAYAATAEQLAAAAADPSAPEHTCGLPAPSEQFITRRVGGALRTEHVRRLANDFPSTAREAREHAERTRMHASVLGAAEGGAAARLLAAASAAAPAPDGAGGVDGARLSELAAAAEAEAAAAAAHAARGPLDELATRARARKDAGNAAFAQGSYHEAAVKYTEALALSDEARQGGAGGGAAGAVQLPAEHTVRCNRAAAFLKLGRYEQALADAEACAAVEPALPKAHFRRGLALQALERYDEALSAFSRARELEPSNAQVGAALRMAEMQLRRQRMAAGGA